MFERWRCWRTGHVVIMSQVRDESGHPTQPHTLVWSCGRCGRVLGTTTTVVLRVDPYPQERTNRHVSH